MRKRKGKKIRTLTVHVMVVVVMVNRLGGLESMAGFIGVVGDDGIHAGNWDKSRWD